MRIPGPADLLRVAEQGYGALEKAIALVPRLVGMVSEIEIILQRVQAAVSNIEHIQKRAAAAVDHIADIELRVNTVLDTASGLVGRAGNIVESGTQLVGRVGPLLDRFEPVLEKLEPILARLAETTSPSEIDAMVKLLDALPNIVDKLDADILPVLDTLGTVAPDLRDLLDVSKELNELIGSVPGLGRVKRKIEEKQDQEDAYRALEEPPAAPDRRSPEHPAEVLPTVN